MKPIERVMPSKESAHYAMAHLPMEDFEALRIDQQRYRKLREWMQKDSQYRLEHALKGSTFDAAVDALPGVSE